MKNLNGLIKKAIPLTALLLVLAPALVSAQLPTVSPPTVPGTTLAEIETILERVGQFILVLGVIFALIYIIIGGVAWMRAGGDPAKIETAKTRIWSGVWGALVVIAVGLILQTLAGVVTRTFFN